MSVDSSPAPNIVPFPNLRTRHAELPDYVAEELTGDPLADLSKVFFYINLEVGRTLRRMRDERAFKAKCRELNLDPDIARKVSSSPEDPIDRAIFSLSAAELLLIFAKKQCELLAQAAAARAAVPVPSRRRKAR